MAADLETRGDSDHITPPSGRSYYACVGERVRVCSECKGEGHWDSCFDCGNRGYFTVEGSGGNWLGPERERNTPLRSAAEEVPDA